VGPTRISQGLGDVGGAGQAEADGQVAQDGHEAGPLPVRTWERSSSKVCRDPVQVFHAPVAADTGRDLGIGGLRGGKAGNRVDDFGPPFLSVGLAGLADDLDSIRNRIPWTRSRP
jgi:hypothetical protein